MTYEECVYAASLAARELGDLRVRQAQAVEARDLALARAWEARPGGVTWHDLVDAVCEGLPPAARFTVSAARVAVRGARG